MNLQFNNIQLLKCKNNRERETKWIQTNSNSITYVDPVDNKIQYFFSFYIHSCLLFMTGDEGFLFNMVT